MDQQLYMAAELLLADDPTPARFARILAGDDLDDMVRRALDPDDARLAVVGWPGQRLSMPLLAGDLIVRGTPGARRRIAVVGDPALFDQRQARGAALVTVPEPGRFVRTLEPGTVDGEPVYARRIAGPDGLVLPDVTIVRPWASETVPVPAGARPTIRQGSGGPAVAAAQGQLNTIHSRLLMRGAGGIERCPLAVDGRFGPATRAATLSFQRLAFPGVAAEWDGIIGPKTWAMLDLHARADVPDQPPPIMPPLPPIVPPVIPVVFRPLDPPRWASILGGLTAAPLRTQNAVRALVDGPETYRTMLDDLRRAANARSFVYLLGWDCYDNFPMDPSAPAPCDTSLNRVLAAAVAAGAQVRAMVWLNVTGADKVRAVREVAGRINLLPDGACILDRRHGGAGRVDPRAIEALLTAITTGLAPLTLLPGISDEVQRLRRDLADQIERAARAGIAAHHQKVLIVFDGDRLVAYCGGLDLNPNRATTSTNCIPRSTPEKIEPSDPQHDTHCRIVGPAAADLLATFVDRWLDHPEHGAIDAAKGALRGHPVASIPAPPVPDPGPADAPHGASTSVIIARTYNPPAGGVIPRQRDIATLLLRGVDRAERFIYFEDQYLWNFDTTPGATLALATALNRRLPHLSHVTAVIPANAISAFALFQRAWRLRFIAEVRRGHPPEVAQRFQVYQPSRGVCTDDGCLGAHTYVHSKCWVFDDELAVIGSANCNRRGYQHDSEVDAFIFDDVAPGGGGTPLLALASSAAARSGEASPALLTFAQRFRMRLWREHLGLTVADGTDISGWPTGAAVVGNVTRLKTDRPLVINATIDRHGFPAVDSIAERARPIIDPMSP